MSLKLHGSDFKPVLWKLGPFYQVSLGPKAGGSGGRRGRSYAHIEDPTTLIHSWTSGGRRPEAEAASDWLADVPPLFPQLFAF